MKWICMIFLPLFSSAVCAEVYQWRDEHGRWHFSDAKAAAGRAEAFKPSQPMNSFNSPEVVAEPITTTYSRQAAQEHPQLRERRLLKEKCERLRSQVKRKGDARRAQEDRYDRECVLPSKW